MKSEFAISLTLNESQIKQAIRDYVHASGFGTTDHFSVGLRLTRGDRPFDVDYWDATVSGVVQT